VFKKLQVLLLLLDEGLNVREMIHLFMTQLREVDASSNYVVGDQELSAAIKRSFPLQANDIISMMKVVFKGKQAKKTPTYQLPMVAAQPQFLNAPYQQQHQLLAATSQAHLMAPAPQQQHILATATPSQPALQQATVRIAHVGLSKPQSICTWCTSKGSVQTTSCHFMKANPSAASYTC